MAIEHTGLPQTSSVPDPDQPVVVGRGERSSVGAPRERLDSLPVAGEAADFDVTPHLPYPNRAADARRREQPAVWAERHREHGPPMAAQDRSHTREALRGEDERVPRFVGLVGRRVPHRPQRLDREQEGRLRSLTRDCDRRTGERPRLRDTHLRPAPTDHDDRCSERSGDDQPQDPSDQEAHRLGR
jgi:hypothetical protein